MSRPRRPADRPLGPTHLPAVGLGDLVRLLVADQPPTAEPLEVHPGGPQRAEEAVGSPGPRLAAAWARLQSDPERKRALADLLGLEDWPDLACLWQAAGPPTAPAPDQATREELRLPEPVVAPSVGPDAAPEPFVPGLAALPEAPMPWRVVAVEHVDEAPEPRSAALGDLADLDRGGSLLQLPPSPPLVPWSRLEPRLLDALAPSAPGAEVDLERAVEQLATLRLLDPIPRRRLPRWPDLLRVWVDLSPRHLPVRPDQLLVLRALADHLGDQALRALGVGITPDPQSGLWGELDLPSGSLVLVLGDLGITADAWRARKGGGEEGAVETQRWAATGRALAARGVSAIALVPVSWSRVPPELRASWQVLPWDPTAAVGEAGASESPFGSSGAAGGVAEAVERLLLCLSPARLIQPGLLRAIRMLLPPHLADVGTELDAWQGELGGQSASGAVLRPDQARSYRERFGSGEVRLGLDLRGLHRPVRDVLAAWHAAMPIEVRAAETIHWLETPGLGPSEAGPGTPPPGDLEEATRWLQALVWKIDPARPEGGDPGEVGLWRHLARGLLGPIAEDGLRTAPSPAGPRPALRELLRLVKASEAVGQSTWTEAELAQPGEPATWWNLRLVGGRLRFERAEQVSDPWLEPLRPGSPVARILTRGFVAVHPGRTLGDLAGAVDRSAHPRFRLEEGLELDLQVMGLRRAEEGKGGPAPASPATVLTLDLGPQRLTLAREARPAWAVAWGCDRYGAWAEEDFNGVIQRFRWIPPGRFWMGSPAEEWSRFDDEQRHRVTLTQGFWLGDTPVTQALWKAVAGQNPSRFLGDRLPVDSASWEDVQEWLRQRARQGGSVLADDLRLPTEAEWEYACRAGTTTATWRGDLAEGRPSGVLDKVAWYEGNSGGKTHPVASLAANPWGLHDQLGNVWEWCADAYAGDLGTSDAVDPCSAEHGASDRVHRGGTWDSPAQGCRAAYRIHGHPSFRWLTRGFRLARGPQRTGPAGGEGRRGPTRSGRGGAEPAGASDEWPPPGPPAGYREDVE